MDEADIYTTQVPVAPNYWGYGLHYCDNMLGPFSDQASSLRYSGAVAGDTWATSINLYTEQVLLVIVWLQRYLSTLSSTSSAVTTSASWATRPPPPPSRCGPS